MGHFIYFSLDYVRRRQGHSEWCTQWNQSEKYIAFRYVLWLNTLFISYHKHHLLLINKRKN